MDIPPGEGEPPGGGTLSCIHRHSLGARRCCVVLVVGLSTTTKPRERGAEAADPTQN
jgi:hypothetical protein